MTPLERALRRVASDVSELEYSFAVVGGLAVSVRAEPRLIRDADLAVAVDDDRHAEAFVRALAARGHTVVAAVEHEVTSRLATARLVAVDDADGLVTDLLFASSGIEGDVVARAEMLMVLADLDLPVASVGDLIALKLLARDDRHRPTDADDLRALREVATEGDWLVAEDAVTGIEERGYGRGRDLRAALVSLRRDGPW